MKKLILPILLLSFQFPLAFANVVGEKAPDFSAETQEGAHVTLSQFKGKPVLLYFYPKDDTPGCTKQACKIRDGFSQFKKMGIVVFGVSRQDKKSHQDFKLKYHLPFDLLVDTDGKIAKLFEIDTMPLVGFFKRQSILIGADGVVHKIYKDVNPETHADIVLKDAESLVQGLGQSH